MISGSARLQTGMLQLILKSNRGIPQMQSLSKAALTLIFDNPEPLAILSMNRYNIKKSAHPIPAPFQTRGKPGGGWSAWNGAWDGRTEDQEMNNRLCVIGEALIDFIPDRKGQRLKDVSGFKRVAGGAPADRKSTRLNSSHMA